MNKPGTRFDFFLHPYPILIESHLTEHGVLTYYYFLFILQIRTLKKESIRKSNGNS